MEDAEERIERRLDALRDEGYRAFQCGLMPTVPPERVLGVRVPRLRALSRELDGTPEASAFLRALPHRTYEADNLHGLLLCRFRGYAETVAALEAFLPRVDNWATCDLLSPRAFRDRPPQLVGQLGRWMGSGQTYAVRFGIGQLMSLYLDGAFSPEYPAMVASVRSREYYVRMMAAWYFATALAKQYDAALPYLRERRLDAWTHNKAIQKAVESRRLPPERKEALRALRVPAGGKDA